MSWETNIRDGSFRGVPFVVQDAEQPDGGRVLVKHRFPKRDVGYNEDLRRKDRVFRVECVVFGDDYMVTRDRLLDALEAAGPGTLIHPHRGTKWVDVDTFSCREGNGNDRSARFSISFVEAGEVFGPTMSIDTATDVTLNADEAMAALGAAFESSFEAPQTSLLQTSALGVIDSIVSGVDTVVDVATGLTAPAEALRANIASLSAAAATLIGIPGNLAISVMGIISGIEGSLGLPWRAIESYKKLFDFGSDAQPIAETTLTRQIEAQNRAALFKLVRHAAVISAARTAATWEPTTFDEAMALMEELAGRLNDVAGETTDDAYEHIIDLRVALYQDLSQRATRLPHLVTYTPQITRTAIELAYELYGDPGRDGEICDRNNIRHPGFVPGGVPIWVLNA